MPRNTWGGGWGVATSAACARTVEAIPDMRWRGRGGVMIPTFIVGNIILAVQQMGWGVISSISSTAVANMVLAAVNTG